MITDFRISTAFLRNGKTRRLRRELGADGVLSLVALWAWARENHPTGQFAADEDDIEAAADWRGDAGKLFAVLTRDKWLDKTPGKENGRQRWSIHEWAEHQPWAVQEPERVEDGKRGAHVKHHINKGAMRPDQCPYCKEDIRDAVGGLVGGLQLPLSPNAPAPSPFPSPAPSRSPAPIAFTEKERNRARKSGGQLNVNWFMAYAYRKRKFDDRARTAGGKMLDRFSEEYREEHFEHVGIYPEGFDALQRAFVAEYGPAFCEVHDVDPSTGRCRNCTFWSPSGGER